MVVVGSILQPPYLRRRSEDPPSPALLATDGDWGRPVSETHLIVIRLGARSLAPCSAPGLLRCCRLALHRRGTWCSPSRVLHSGPQAESWRLSCRTVCRV